MKQEIQGVIKTPLTSQEKHRVDAQNAISKISESEPEMLEQVSLLLQHVAGTYSDKYADAKQTGDYDTKEGDLYHPLKGQAINVYQLRRYLQRYTTAGHAKSGNPVDVRKGIHYLLFELVRNARHGVAGSHTDDKIAN
jgi:hypothetical protein